MAGFWVQSLAGVGTWGNQLMFLSPSPSCLLSLKINKIFLKTDCLKLFSSFILLHFSNTSRSLLRSHRVERASQVGYMDSGNSYRCQRRVLGASEKERQRKQAWGEGDGEGKAQERQGERERGEEKEKEAWGKKREDGMALQRERESPCSLPYYLTINTYHWPFMCWILEGSIKGLWHYFLFSPTLVND